MVVVAVAIDNDCNVFIVGYIYYVIHISLSRIVQNLPYLSS
jgi:hypothetical protein